VGYFVGMFHGIMWKFDRSGFMVTWCGYTWDILGYLMGIFNEDMSWALCSPTVSFNSGDDNAPWMEWATRLPHYFRPTHVAWSKLDQTWLQVGIGKMKQITANLQVWPMAGLVWMTCSGWRLGVIWGPFFRKTAETPICAICAMVKS